jgi:AcrR family transcriptional regulator
MVMATQGVDAVKVEVLARQLGVSKGSFYWHFKNRAELLEEILQRWEQETTWAIKESQKEPTASDRLSRLFALIEEICERLDPEPAIFLWAKQEQWVAERVQMIEAKRVNYLTELLQDYGFAKSEALKRAEVAYLSLMGYAEWRERDSQLGGSLHQFTHFLLLLLLTPISLSEKQKNLVHLD